MNYKNALRIVGYLIGVGGLLTAQVLGPILTPWGFSPSQVSRIAGEVGSIVLMLTLIYSVVVKPAPPDGYHSVISADPNPTPATITTATAVAAPPPAAAPPQVPPPGAPP